MNKSVGAISITNNFFFQFQNLGKNEKRPKTIHRCILQKMTSLDTNSSSKRISCHGNHALSSFGAKKNAHTIFPLQFAAKAMNHTNITWTIY